MRILILGDIIGAAGMRAVVTALQTLKRTYRADVVIANGENADAGFGITAELVQQLLRVGVDIVTSGNHVWRAEGVAELLQSEPRLLRPQNYPPELAGSGWAVIDHPAGRVAVLNLQGRDRMSAIDDPFRAARLALKAHKGHYDFLVVDFHAESPHEKEALAHTLEGKATVVFGTHTHIQTTDESILPRGTAYITDIGACMPIPSVIGFDHAISVRRALTQLPIRNQVAVEAATIHGLLVQTAERGPAAVSVERVRYQSIV